MKCLPDISKCSISAWMSWSLASLELPPDMVVVREVDTMHAVTSATLDHVGQCFKHRVEWHGVYGKQTQDMGNKRPRECTNLSRHSVHSIASSHSRVGAVITKINKVYTHRDLVAEAQQAPEHRRARQSGICVTMIRMLVPDQWCSTDPQGTEGTRGNLFEKRPGISVWCWHTWRLDRHNDGGHCWQQRSTRSMWIWGSCMRNYGQLSSVSVLCGKRMKLNLSSSKGERQVRQDHRTWGDHILRRAEAFDHQMDEMVMGYLHWCHKKSHCRSGVNFFSERPVGESSEKADGDSEGHWIGIVVNIFRESSALVDGDQWLTQQLVKTLRKSTLRLMKVHQTHPYQLPCSIMASSQVRHTSPPSLLPLRRWNSFASPTTAAHISLCELMWRRCRDWYISVGISSISPTFSESPFTLNILPNASLTSPSPAVLVRRYSSTPERRSSQSSISELSICPYLIIVHSTTSRSRRPSLPHAFHGLWRPHHCSSLHLLIPDRSHVTAAIQKCSILSRQMVAPVCSFPIVYFHYPFGFHVTASSFWS